MNTIHLQGNISPAQYNEAVRALEAIGLKVIPTAKKERSFTLTEAQKKSIRIGIEQAKNGQLTDHLEVDKKAQEICGL